MAIIAIIAIVTVSVGVGVFTLTDSSQSSESMAPAEFEISNLSISPSEVEPGENVNVSVDVSNVGEKEGTYTIKMTLDGVVEETENVTLSGGESTTVSFTVTKETKKSYSVGFGDLSQSFEVVAPAEIEVTNLSISPSQVESGGTVNVSADVSNVGDLSGDYTVELKIDGTSEDSQTVALSGGDSTEVSFTITKTTEKTYDVDMGGLTGSFEVITPTFIEGIISEDTIWTVGKSPYVVTGNILIDEGVTLEVESGTTIKFNEDCYLQVDGSLTAIGSDDSMITFTSNKENPMVRDWKGIKRNFNANITLDYVIIEFADVGIDGIGSHDSGDTEISHSILKNNYVGIYSYYSAPHITYTAIQGNQIGLSCHGVTGEDRAPVINHSNIYNNTQYNIRYDHGSHDIEATNNYWGTVEENKIDASIYDFYDDYSLGKVIYKPVATEPF